MGPGALLGGAIRILWWPNSNVDAQLMPNYFLDLPKHQQILPPAILLDRRLLLPKVCWLDRLGRNSGGDNAGAWLREKAAFDHAVGCGTGPVLSGSARPPAGAAKTWVG